jgi:hypothetical protein
MLAQYQTQLDTQEQAYKMAVDAANLKRELLQYVPEGTDINARIGALTGLSDQAKGMYENFGKAQQLQQVHASTRPHPHAAQDAAAQTAAASTELGTPQIVAPAAVLAA